MTGLAQKNSSSTAISQAPLKRISSTRLILRLLIQLLIILVVGSCIVVLIYKVHAGFRAHGVEFGFGYLSSPSGIQITDGITLSPSVGFPWVAEFTPDLSNLQAYVTGLINTITVVVITVLLSSLLGTMLALGRVSSNWVLTKVCFGIIEFIRNTPLLIQVTFWYFAVILNFPPAVVAAKYINGLIISKQGIFLPAVSLNASSAYWGIAALVLTLCAYWACAYLPSRVARGIAKLAVLCAGITLIYAAHPLILDFPEVTRFSAKGGNHLSAEMVALILGLSVNGCAYIAEILRGGLETLPKGQGEAASSLGFGHASALKNIILPQVFRVVLPSLGNQFISLAKNTSIGIAIGYPDLFNVTGTISNQTGRTLEGILLMVIAYLAVSWTISGLTQLAGRFVNKSQKGKR